MTTRFAVAVHVLVFLQRHGDEPASSEVLAGSVGTNPSLIRRLLSRLNRAGLTRSRLGTGGGALLARPADAISLLEVYRAVEDDEDVIPLHPSPHPQCPVGGRIKRLLTPRIEAVRHAMHAELARTTIADLAVEIDETPPLRPDAAAP